MRSNRLMRLAATLPMLLALLSSCASPFSSRSPVALETSPVAIPQLPEVARQPSLPAWCSPTCAAAVARELQSWRLRLTQPEAPASPASGPTTR